MPSPSPVATFGLFQSLLSRSVDLDPNLDSATKASMKTRVANLAREQEIVLDWSRSNSVSGNVSENAVSRSIDVATGSPATPNRVEFDAIQFFVPVNVDGTHGVRGFLPGHAGTSVATLVDQGDMTLQYRLAASDPWSTFDRTSLLRDVTWIQFACNIANQSGATTLPAIHIHAEQV